MSSILGIAKTGKGIVASFYAETLGTPVLFNKKYFNELLNLKGQEGAKKIINRFLDDTASIPFEKGYIDIDTEVDYNKLISELQIELCISLYLSFNSFVKAVTLSIVSSISFKVVNLPKLKRIELKASSSDKPIAFKTGEG